MSDIKFSPDLFLGSQELNRLLKFIVDDGYRQTLIKNSYSFGIIRELSDTSFLNFRVQVGTNVGTYKIQSDSYALDSDGELIYQKAIDNISIPDDNTWYNVIIEHEKDPREQGTVNIDAAGNLTGTGTLFSKVLRGLPNIPSKIAFPDSAQNTGEYEVNSVINNTSAVLNGVFTSENDQKYKVVGSFTPGISPSVSDKDIFQYSSCLITLDSAASPILVSGKQFIVARVRNNGGVVSIEDKRTNFWQQKGEYFFNLVPASINPLVGVEAVKFDSPFSTRSQNIVEIAWSFRSDNFTLNTEQNLITINSGQGGKFKTTNDFTNGDFDGWRIYLDSSKEYDKIVSSVKSGSQINVTLERLNISDYNGFTELLITPDHEDIEIRILPDSLSSTDEGILEQKVSFPINRDLAKIRLLVPDNSYSYNFSYRYKNNNQYSVWSAFPDDPVGYYDESSFTTDGVLEADPGDRNRVPYVSDVAEGYILLTAPPDSYSQTVTNIPFLSDIVLTEETTIDLSTLTPNDSYNDANFDANIIDAVTVTLNSLRQKLVNLISGAGTATDNYVVHRIEPPTGIFNGFELVVNLKQPGGNTSKIGLVTKDTVEGLTTIVNANIFLASSLSQNNGAPPVLNRPYGYNSGYVERDLNAATGSNLETAPQFYTLRWYIDRWFVVSSSFTFIENFPS